MAQIATVWAVFQGLLLEALPFLLIGVAISSLARALDPSGHWLQKLPKGALLGPMSGALLGFALPACECGNVPVARRLLAVGAPLGTAFGFLFAAPVLNPVVLLSTWAAFPDKPWLLLLRPAGSVVIALVLSGLLQLISESKLLNSELLAERRLSQPLAAVSLLERSTGLIGQPLAALATDPKASVQTKPAGLLSHGVNEFLELGSLLVLGCAVAALIQTLIPRDLFLALGQAPTLSVVSLMLLALVVSVCSSVDAFLALGFADQVTPGALLAFLLLGPVIDLKSVSLLGRVFTWRAMGLVLAGVSLTVLLMGQALNLLLL
ncbi:permease [Synechococcus lacustris]|uniref:permease n=1 Tax=Synechococcus lacustris TaxID=2116544 RepID=UPI0020CC94EF|nr:permease [Synechococcus lacustris]MCP9794661.1 permease [Synechococcus lacustris L1F-Slac]